MLRKDITFVVVSASSAQRTGSANTPFYSLSLNFPFPLFDLVWDNPSLADGESVPIFHDFIRMHRSPAV